MRSETRLVVFSNDAVVLSLAAFPYYIGRWSVRSLKTRDVNQVLETEAYTLRDRMVWELCCKRREAYQSIEKRLSDIPPGFTPKVNWMECITGDAGHHLYARDTVHPRYSTDEGHQKVIMERIERVWNKALKVRTIYDGPRLKTPSVLLLDKIGGDTEKARDAEYLWPIYDEIIVNGNELARTPICGVMDRDEVKRSVWEYRPREEP